MKFEVSTQIHAPKEAVWKTITDIEHSVTTVSAIQKIEVLERPAEGLVGFKWREARTDIKALKLALIRMVAGLCGGFAMGALSGFMKSVGTAESHSVGLFCALAGLCAGAIGH